LLNNSNIPTTSHNALFFQQRHPTSDEITAGTIRRRKPTCQQQIGHDYSTIKNNTTIMHPRNESIMYLAENLHHVAHGSVAAGDVLSHEIVFDTLGIPNNIISPPTPK
jgi:hypothetical protein